MSAESINCSSSPSAPVGLIVGVNVPVVVRLEGNSAEIGSDKLSKSGLNIISASGLEDAAKLAVEASKGVAS